MDNITLGWIGITIMIVTAFIHYNIKKFLTHN
jgi:hypothetical protein